MDSSHFPQRDGGQINISMHVNLLHPSSHIMYPLYLHSYNELLCEMSTLCHDGWPAAQTRLAGIAEMDH